MDIFQQINFEEKNVHQIKLIKYVENIDNIVTDEFNQLIEYLFQKMGYTTQIIDGINDKGIDILVLQNKQIDFVVQCKAWNPHKNNQFINKKDIQSFKGAMSDQNYNKGIFLTTTYFTEPALKEENSKLKIIDRELLFKLLSKYCPEIFSPAYSSNFDIKLTKCKSCNQGKLIKLYSQNIKKPYMECSNCHDRTSLK